MRALLPTLILLVILPAPLNAQKQAFTLPEAKALYDEWGFSGAVRSGDLVYVSGVVAGLREGETSMEPAFARAFDNIAATLKLAGASWDDVVDMTTYHVDVTGQMAPFRAVKSRYVKAPFPAWTAIGVSRLIPPNGLVEIKVVARIPAKGRGQ
jgi:enamine deaminase RidA (YjgF/YER057c/UK114 family)